MSTHTEALALATAALMDIISTMQAYQAAVIQGDVQRQQDLRGRAHDLLDAYLDLNGEAAVAVRAMLGN